MLIKNGNTITITTTAGTELQISCGNRKMLAGYGIFNLPAVTTCPNSTPLCRKLCYARKAERVYSSVLDRRQTNFKASQEADFMPIMIDLINQLANEKTFNGKFRIHESGDFYNQLYLDNWLEIARNFPAIEFLAFTKSINFDYSSRPDNLKIYISVMPDTDFCAPIHPSIANTPRAFAGIIPDNVEPTQCPGHCDSCNHCFFNNTGDVYFSLH